MSPYSPEWIKASFQLKDDFQLNTQLIQQVKQSFENNQFENLIDPFKNGRTERFKILITHDIDWLHVWHPYSVIKSFAHKNWIKPWHLVDPTLFTDNIDAVLDLEHQMNIKSIWFTGGSKDWFSRNGIRYRVGSSAHRQTLSKIASQGHFLGYHSSVKADSQAVFNTELNALNQLISSPVIFHRSHLLKGDLTKRYSWMIQSGITTDMTSGHARTPGFANGFPGTMVYQGVKSVPVMLMDNAFFFTSKNNVLKEFSSALQQLKNNNGTACICFHPENMAVRPSLHQTFYEILHLCKEEGALNLN